MFYHGRHYDQACFPLGDPVADSYSCQPAFPVQENTPQIVLYMTHLNKWTQWWSSSLRIVRLDQQYCTDVIYSSVCMVQHAGHPASTRVITMQSARADFENPIAASIPAECIWTMTVLHFMILSSSMQDQVCIILTSSGSVVPQTTLFKLLSWAMAAIPTNLSTSSQ